MKFTRILKWSLFAIVGQIVLFFVAESLGDAQKVAFLSIYLPFLWFGEYFLPSGPGGHAMPIGALIGVLAGVIVYSIVVAIGICLLKKN